MQPEQRASLLPVAVVLLAAAVLVVVAITWRQSGGTPQTVLAMPLDSPARPGADALDWCLGNSAAGGYGPVIEVGREFFGMQRRLSDSGAEGLRDDPLFPQSCALAYEIWGLTAPEWDWCFDRDNRTKWLEPSIVLLGLGKNEALGTESFGEAPGDNPAEYVEACRFAYRYARPADGIPRVDAQTHPFLALAPDASTWCEAHRSELERAARALDIGVAPAADSAEVPAREAYVRACRFARIRAAAT